MNYVKPRRRSETKWVLAWTSGHVPPRTMYYRATENGWGASKNPAEAYIFPSKKKALNRWREVHASPEDYERCITEGSTRAENLSQPELQI